MPHLEEALSGEDIQNVLGPDIPIYTYADLAQFDTLAEAWAPQRAMVILYESTRGRGHWVCVFENAGRICVFDSYGIVPDQELAYIDDNFRQESDQGLPHLSYLMYKSGYPVEYNSHKLQKFDDAIATCGKWVIARLLLRHLSVDRFANTIRRMARLNHTTTDHIVARLYDMLK